MKKNTTEWNLCDLLEQGGIYYDVPGTNVKELLANAVDLLTPAPTLDPHALLNEVISRETLMSTGVGRGIALPHPRSPVIGENDKPFVALIFPSEPLDWNTPDGSRVHTVFLIVSSSAKQHLNALSKINFLCQKENIYYIIKQRSPKKEIIAEIRKTEKTWLRSS